MVESDPASSVIHPKYEVKPPRIFSKTEYRALRDVCREDARIAAIMHAWRSAIRSGFGAENVSARVKNLKLRAKSSIATPPSMLTAPNPVPTSLKPLTRPRDPR